MPIENQNKCMTETETKRNSGSMPIKKNASTFSYVKEIDNVVHRKKNHSQPSCDEKNETFEQLGALLSWDKPENAVRHTKPYISPKIPKCPPKCPNQF